MASPKDKLPRFERAPVVEVALSAQFQNLPKLTVGHLGLLWGIFRERFPNAEQHAPIPHVVERKGVRQAPNPPQISLLADSELIPRMWMVSADGNELVQVQADRFIRNWRKYRSPHARYPHYEEYIRPCFIEDYSRFETFVRDEGLGDLAVDQCEVTYVNHIHSEGVWSTHGQLQKVFRCYSGPLDTTISAADGVAIKMSHPINVAEQFIGRLTMEITAGFVPPSAGDGEPVPIFMLQFVARGRPREAGIKGILDFFDLGRRMIVSTFASVTTPEMHNAWRRTQ
jgi:uncharacterized protein (TIGR04255 family)